MHPIFTTRTWPVHLVFVKSRKYSKLSKICKFSPALSRPISKFFKEIFEKNTSFVLIFYDFNTKGLNNLINFYLKSDAGYPITHISNNFITNQIFQIKISIIFRCHVKGFRTWSLLTNTVLLTLSDFI